MARPKKPTKRKQPLKPSTAERTWSARFLNASVDAMSIPENLTATQDSDIYYITRRTAYNIADDGTLVFRIRIEGRLDEKESSDPLFWVNCSNAFKLAVDSDGDLVGTNVNVPITLVAQLLIHAQMTIRGLIRAVPNHLLSNIILPPVQFKQTVPDTWKTDASIATLLDLHI